MIHLYDFYKSSICESTSLTYYTHLEFHCLNDELDEKCSWKISINKCSHNDYRCLNEQCITLTFCLDKDNHFDKSDEHTFE
jgi:hypothetical protein